MKNEFGYHINNINKGIIGECSKIIEEIEEIIDAEKQNARIMVLVELSDLLGAIFLYIENYELDIDIELLSKLDPSVNRHITSKFLLKNAILLEKTIKLDTEKNVKNLIINLNSYLLTNFPGFSILDLYIMSNITERAFNNGYRQ